MIDISPSLLPLSDWSLPMGFRVVCHAPHMLACSSDIVSGGQNQNHNQEPALILLKKTLMYCLWLLTLHVHCLHLFWNSFIC